MNCFVTAAGDTVTNGTQFKDTSGNVIHAHGGCIVQYEDYYYWYGEYRDNSNYFLGVRCYRSADLVNWEYRGEVLKPSSASDLKRCNVERPKVMYNASTKEFVMWMHWENGTDYGQARAAVAYCKTPDGNYTYQGSFRPLKGTGVTDHGLDGYMARDCSVFVDTDGKGYFIAAANENMDLILYELSPDYKSIASIKTKLFVGNQREAPCLIKRNGYYYLITSGCTGWKPNQGKYAYSRSLGSGWSSLYNLGDGTTYNSQPAFIIPVQGSTKTTYLYTGDRWAGAWGGKVNDSQYVWLPLVFRSDTQLELPYYDSVRINTATGDITENLGNVACCKIVNENSGKVLDVKDSSQAAGGEAIQRTDTGSQSQKWYIADAGSGYKKIVNANSGLVLEVKGQSTSDGGVVCQWTANGGTNQQWKFTDIGNGCIKIINRNSSKLLDVTKSSTEDGTAVQQWADTGGKNQQWKLVEIQSSYTPTPVKPTSTPTRIVSPTPIEYRITGYVNPGFLQLNDRSTVKKGFTVELVGTGKSVVTDDKGYFEITGVQSDERYTLKIDRSNFLYREVHNYAVQSDAGLQVPISMWAGDIPINGKKDNAINMKDIIEMAKSFNKTSVSAEYSRDCDINEDNAVNMTDIVLAAAHFNKTSANYDI